MQMLAPQLVEMGTYDIIEFSDAFLIVVAIHGSAMPQLKSAQSQRIYFSGSAKTKSVEAGCAIWAAVSG
jgi:hypothetical protein